MLLAASLVIAATPSPVALTSGIVISKSCTIAAREYLLPSVQGIKRAGNEEIPTFQAAVTIRGNNITVDFSDATLRGTEPATEPDQRKGLAIKVDGVNVTVKNVHVHGFKVGLLATNCVGLRVITGDFSYNWKQHLLSTPIKENEADWQSYHHNEHNEWLRYGAAIYLEKCADFEVKGCRTHGGQCGLLLVRSHNGIVLNNDFSFMSGVGLGLYASRANTVLYNKVDWCIRGFSYGVYNRGQDSAGILVFELSTANLFAFNSVTHSGDGFFLWAGQTMMDTGMGGCNGNVVYGNDFSHSPCNAIEATFSSNTFVNNKLVECWHGVWGGYSFDTKIIGNVFGFNGNGISIEHGQNNTIRDNLFVHENTDISLWQDPILDKNWPYQKHHDTVSRDYQIEGNLFYQSSGPAIAIRDTRQVLVGGNQFKQCASAIKEQGSNPGSKFDLGPIESGTPSAKTISEGGKPVEGTSDDVGAYLRRFDLPWNPYANIEDLEHMKPIVSDAGGKIPGYPGKNRNDVFLKLGSLRGQRYIIVDAWGPYDFNSPKICPREVIKDAPVGTTRQRFELLGPPGKWRLVSQSGVTRLSSQSGSVPGFVDIDLAAESKINLEYTGSRTVDYRGVPTEPGMPIAFGYNSVH